jgi:hypothetical protein
MYLQSIWRVLLLCCFEVFTFLKYAIDILYLHAQSSVRILYADLLLRSGLENKYSVLFYTFYFLSLATDGYESYIIILPFFHSSFLSISITL